MTPTTTPQRGAIVLSTLALCAATLMATNAAHATGNTAGAPAADDEPEGGEADIEDTEAGVFEGDLSDQGGSFGPDSDPEPTTAPASASSEPPLCVDLPVTSAEAYEGDNGQWHRLTAEMWEEENRPEQGAYAVYTMCRDPNIDCTGPADCVYDEIGNDADYEWRFPGATTQADLIDALYTDLQGMVETPIVSTNPGEDQASIVNVPTFFTVDNWQGPFDAEPECAPEDPDFCVWATLTPRIALDPGEPGVGSLDCQGPGQPYDRYAADGDPFIQAGWPATCTHTYTQRTGANDRPEEWTVTLSIIWDIEWFPEDAEGTPILETTATTTRQVNEIHAVVTD